MREEKKEEEGEKGKTSRKGEERTDCGSNELLTSAYSRS